MILKKPYAFLIKNFKLLHFILTILLSISLYRTTGIISFFNEYLKTPKLLNNIESLGTLFPLYMFIIPLVIILVCIIILCVLFNKKKPYLLYIIVITFCVGLLALYNISYNMIIDMQVALANIRTVRIIRDLYTVVVVVNGVITLLMLIRATGFDIKKFNFVKDLQELNIDEKDNEEFELDLSVDSNEIRRGFRRKLRYLKYVYVEKKFLINMIILILLAVICFTFYFVKMIYHKNYDQSVTFQTDYFVMHIDDVYVTNKDYQGNKLTDKYLVIVDLKLKSFTTKGRELDTVNCSLIVGNNTYSHTNKYRDFLTDLGVVYDEQLIYTKNLNYLLVYEIPINSIDKDMTFRYTNGFDIFANNLNPKYVKVKLKLNNLDTNHINKKYEIGDTINFEDSIIDNTSLVINTYEINNTLTRNYRFCVNKDECYDSIEYIKPSIGNYDKSLIMIDGSIDFNDNISGIYNLYNFISKFGKIEYTIGDINKKMMIPFKRVTPNNNIDDIYYLEIIKEIENANNISIKFYIRNRSYEYVLK